MIRTLLTISVVTVAIAPPAWAGVKAPAQGKVHVVLGDITQIKADGIIVPINPWGDWRFGVNGAIQRVAKDQYHAQARRVLEKRGLKHLDTVLAQKTAPHDGAFRDVMFVVDGLGGPVSDVVYAGLKAAHDAQWTSVSMPLIRTGEFLGQVEKTVTEVADGIEVGTRRFLKQHGADADINLVIYNDPYAQELLKDLEQIE
jgi:O-acetyl-ADP-ribose deacetylase (regulator of RNase III)